MTRQNPKHHNLFNNNLYLYYINFYKLYTFAANQTIYIYIYIYVCEEISIF
jgi:hypothetical protein